jgi:hypothetical protein
VGEGGAGNRPGRPVGRPGGRSGVRDGPGREGACSPVRNIGTVRRRVARARVGSPSPRVLFPSPVGAEGCVSGRPPVTTPAGLGHDPPNCGAAQRCGSLPLPTAPKGYTRGHARPQPPRDRYRRPACCHRPDDDRPVALVSGGDRLVAARMRAPAEHRGVGGTSDGARSLGHPPRDGPLDRANRQFPPLRRHAFRLESFCCSIM